MTLGTLPEPARNNNAREVNCGCTGGELSRVVSDEEGDVSETAAIIIRRAKLRWDRRVMRDVQGAVPRRRRRKLTERC
jgi:hypothetical protein